MPQEELAMIGSYDYEDGDHLVHWFSIGYIQSKGFAPGFYVDYGDTMRGPFALPSLAFKAAVED